MSSLILQSLLLVETHFNGFTFNTLELKISLLKQIFASQI